MKIWRDESGSSNSYWIGVILKCKFEKWHTEEKKGMWDDTRCYDETCIGHAVSHQGKFCSDCGKAIEPKPTFYKHPIKPDKELPELEQGLELDKWDQDRCEPDDDLEYRIFGNGHWGDCHRYSTNKEFTPEDIQKAIDKFKEQYKGYIGKCEKVFGKENVTVSWGIFSYYHDY